MSDEHTQWQRVELSEKDRHKVYVEVLSMGGREEVGILDSIPFEQVTEVLGEIAQRVAYTLEKAMPTKASVELGVEFGLENGQLVALIARGTGKANLKISMEWERSEPKTASS